MLRSTAENEEHILKMQLFGQDPFPSCPPKVGMDIIHIIGKAWEQG